MSPKNDWLSAPPLEVLRQMDEVCDEFESKCSSLRPEQFPPFVNRIPAEYRGQIFCQLAAIHMETHSQRAASAIATEAYLPFVDATWSHSDVLLCLVTNEMQVSQLLGQPAPVNDYLLRFPKLPEDELRNSIWRGYPVVIQVGHRAPSFFALDRRIVLGRQRTAEPEAVGTREMKDGSLKIVIANREKATVGRNHVALELETDRRVRVTRKTQKASVEVEGLMLPFDDPTPFEVPKTIKLGPITVVIELQSTNSVG